MSIDKYEGVWDKYINISPKPFLGPGSSKFVYKSNMDVCDYYVEEIRAAILDSRAKFKTNIMKTNNNGKRERITI